MFVSNNLLDPRIDQLSTEGRNLFLWDLWRNQLEYACTSKTPAIRQIMRECKLEISDFKNPEDILKFPVITKRMFREFGHFAFLPEKYRKALRYGQHNLKDYEKLHIFPRFTGGTSVRKLSDYTLIRWSNSDWLGAMQSSTRAVLQQNRQIRFPRNVFSNYTFDHIAAPYLTGVITHNNGSYVPRHSNLSDLDAFNMIRGECCDGIISPPAAHQIKGRGLVELLAGDIDIDNPYLTGKRIKLIIVSSTPLTARIYQLFERRGIVVKDAGGSTDVGGVLWNCTEDPLTFHSIEGQALNEVVDRKGYPVRNTQHGLFLCSRIAGVVEADRFLRELYDNIKAAYHRKTIADDTSKTLGNILGRDPSSMSSSELKRVYQGIKKEYEATMRIIPNQATQLMRYSGLMNETQYLSARDCPCGKNTPKMKGLLRTYDFDGSPEDIAVPTIIETNQVERAGDVSGFHLRLPDGCEAVGR